MSKSPSQAWYTKTLSEIEKELETDFKHGLKEEEAKKRLKSFGLNTLPEVKSDSLLEIFFRQFQSSLIYVLLLVCVALFLIGEIADALIILFVLTFNAVVGAIQEGKAQNTLAALKRFVETEAMVLRNGKEIVIPDKEVGPGDILVLHQGEKVPADARIIESRNIKTDESSLTGESVSVSKIKTILSKADLPTADQKNMVFKGTYVVSGYGRAVAVLTGSSTVIGKISQAISSVKTEIPLQKDIRYLSRLIIITVSVISASMFVLGLLLDKSAREMFATVVSLSVSIIPEGLPIVITLVLANGVSRMSRRNALVKKLQAVEALGEANIIAVDKTGTVTKNELVVTRIFADHNLFEITGSGYEPKGEVKLNGKMIEPTNHPELLLAGKIAALSSDVNIRFDEKEKTWRVMGDPTEAAILVASQKIGIDREGLLEEMSQLVDLPFEHETKFHAVSFRAGKSQFLAVAGAPEIILKLSKKIFLNGKALSLTEEKLGEVEHIFQIMSMRGLRVVAFAFRELSLSETLSDIKDLTFGGFYGMIDALRPEVPLAMEKAKQAGMKVVMITGDHKLTAVAIARDAGIFKKGDEVLTGEEIDKLSGKELDRLLTKVTVFSRVTPEHKLKIIQSYRRRGEIVAMTGDGVNDAPSLVAADLGVAMGKIGTEVAKEASDIVLLDDNFGSITSAVEEGRALYKTIKKVILYLFSTSMGEFLTILGALLLGYPLPLLPAQIIWLNLVTDGFLTVALAMEPNEKNLLTGKFSRPKRYFVDKLMSVRIFVMAVPMMVGALFLFNKYFEVDIVKAWTISLTTLAIFQWINAWNCRTENQSFFKTNPLSNKFLVGALFIIIGLQVAAVHAPFMQSILRTTDLSVKEWLIAVVVAFSILAAEEIRKFIYRKWKNT
ncbi:MAG: HAD-IC family P-type ATPase [Candidatus Liptonbacteria bacterium]|nr:HAD-IC family P-type ATPase [Candidatus Liptonbacteria bacterium]